MRKIQRQVIGGILSLCFAFGLGQAAWAQDVVFKPTIQVQQKRQLAPGVTYFQVSGTTIGGSPLEIKVLEAELTRSDVEVRPIFANTGVTGREKLSSMGERTFAQGAINGSFFSTASPYLPVGNLVMDSKIQSVSDMLRTSMGIMENGRVKFGYFNPALHIKADNLEPIAIDKVNRAIGGKEVILYTPEWKPAVSAGAGCTLISLAPNGQGKLEVQETYGTALTTPPNGYLIHLPVELAASFEVGTIVAVNVESDSYWQNLKHLMTGGPLLVEQGEPVFQAVAEGFTGTVLKANPRTAIGVTKDGKMLLVTIDGRSTTSVGVTMEELAYIMKDLGAFEAMGLDGGGSTEMWVQGNIVNKLSEGTERPLNNGIIIVTGIPVYLNGERIYFDVPSQLINGRTLVPFRKLFEAIGAQVDYDSETKMITATKDDKVVQFIAGAKEATVGGELQTLDVPVRELQGRTLVPLRFAGVALGGSVEWTKNKTVVVNVR
jgi:exopolysaccharide biosynthesis protein